MSGDKRSVSTDALEMSNTNIEGQFDRIAERIATARTQALMGEREEARALFISARVQFYRFREILPTYAGMQALEHSIKTAQKVVEKHAEDLL